MKSPFISIVIPSLNQGRFLEETLRSLNDQDFEPLEIIVIDGGSTDSSLEVLQRFEKSIDYWLSEPDSGQSEAIDKGFQRTKGDWITWLNSDDTLLPGALNFLAKEIWRNPKMAWCAGGGWFVDESGRRVKHYPPPPRCVRTEDLGTWTDSWFAQPGTFMRKDLYDKAGGNLRRDLRHAMDLDLWFRLVKLAPLEPMLFDMGTYRLHGDSKTVSERGEMEVEVIQVLYEHLGWRAAKQRVQRLAHNHFKLEVQYRQLIERLASPAGIFGLIRKHGMHVISKWIRQTR